MRTLYPPPIRCGNELARDSGGPAWIDVACAAAIASRLAPTGTGVNSVSVSTLEKCGSELARDNALPDANAVSGLSLAT
ncbi:hypothetical protein C0J56_04820 [Pseudomonas fluorescens]|nr:hypothetical protein C0J56_04820 [Pseudomonas fluorescens]